jgi:hypothetical protein
MTLYLQPSTLWQKARRLLALLWTPSFPWLAAGGHWGCRKDACGYSVATAINWPLRIVVQHYYMSPMSLRLTPEMSSVNVPETPAEDPRGVG